MLAFDHLAFGARDVDAFRRALGRLGFTVTEGGSCRWTLGGSERTARSASVVFPRGYLDVIELRAPGWERHLQSSKSYRLGAAPSGILLSCSSVEQARDALRGREVRCDEPYAIVREQPGAEPSCVHYETASLRTAGLPLGLIHDAAPAAMRRPEWTRHPNGATGVARLHLVAESPVNTCHALARVLGTAAPANNFEMALGDTRLVVHGHPPDAYLAELHAELGTTHRVALLAVELWTSSLQALSACLDDRGVAHVELPRGIALTPDAGYGCGLIFVQAP